MNFGDALEEVKKGKTMRLPHWSFEAAVHAQFPDEHSKMTDPYLYLENIMGRIPWQPSVKELFAEGWIVMD